MTVAAEIKRKYEIAGWHEIPKYGRWYEASNRGATARRCAMATWSELEELAPEIARRGRALLYQHGPPLGFLATIRPDGGPRLHPFCPVVHDGQLWAYVLAASPKCSDLQRDPRFALHAFPGEVTDDEFMVRGRAQPVEPDENLRAGIRAAAEPAAVGADDELLFALQIDNAMVATYTHLGQWPPAYDIWKATAT
jgi:hypothetical protein